MSPLGGQTPRVPCRRRSGHVLPLVSVVPHALSPFICHQLFSDTVAGHRRRQQLEQDSCTVRPLIQIVLAQALKCSTRLLQVYKALRGGVQDVAVKQLLQQDDGHLEEFIKVRACDLRSVPAQTISRRVPTAAQLHAAALLAFSVHVSALGIRTSCIIRLFEGRKTGLASNAHGSAVSEDCSHTAFEAS